MSKRVTYTVLATACALLTLAVILVPLWWWALRGTTADVSLALQLTALLGACVFGAGTMFFGFMASTEPHANEKESTDGDL